MPTPWPVGEVSGTSINANPKDKVSCRLVEVGRLIQNFKFPTGSSRWGGNSDDISTRPVDLIPAQDVVHPEGEIYPPSSRRARVSLGYEAPWSWRMPRGTHPCPCEKSGTVYHAARSSTAWLPAGRPRGRRETVVGLLERSRLTLKCRGGSDRFVCRPLPGLETLVITVIFGAIHCIGWSFDFPSNIERTLWRVASLSVTGVPSLILRLDALASAIDMFLLKFRFNDFTLTMVLLFFLYILSRLALLVLLSCVLDRFLLQPSISYTGFHSSHIYNLQL
jgi:hypothetical protein